MSTVRTITNEEHKKLSKRSGHSSFEDLLEQGFLTEAIVNFVALLRLVPGRQPGVLYPGGAGEGIRLPQHEQIPGSV